MKRAVKLTQEAVDAATPRAKEYIVVDRGGGGLALRVRPNGSKTWQLRWIEDGKRRRISLGDATEIPLVRARERAKDARWMTERASGGDGDGPPPIAFADLAAKFVAAKEKEGKDMIAIRAYTRSQLIPAFGATPAAVISTPRVAS